MTKYLIEELQDSDCERCHRAAEELTRLRDIRHEQQKQLVNVNDAYKRLIKLYEAKVGPLPRRRRNGNHKGPSIKWRKLEKEVAD